MAVTPPMTTTEFANAIDRGVRKHFVDRYKALRPKLEILFKVSDQKDKNEEEMAYTGFGPMQATSEGERYQVDSRTEMYKTTYTPVKYTSTAQASYEMQLWDKTKKLAQASGIGEGQAKQVAREMERVSASVFTKAFTAATTSYGDSKPLCSTDHTRADGATAQSNASSTGITLTHDNLDTAIQALRMQLDDRGQLFTQTPQILLVPPALEQTALVVTKSANRSGVSDNDTNIYGMKEYYGGRLKVVVWEYLANAVGGSDTAWFLLSNEHLVSWKWADKPMVGKMDTTTGYLNDMIFWKVRFYASIGWSDWRGVWGSQGDGAAYSS